MSTIYCWDTSALLDGMVRYYMPASFPRLWQNVDDLVGGGRVIVSEEVREDLRHHQDEAYVWVRDRAGIVVATDAKVWTEAQKITGAHPKFVANMKGKNRSDPFVIAVAILRTATVVTGEQGGNANRPKVPYVCSQFSVPCIGLPDLIQAEGWVFA